MENININESRILVLKNRGIVIVLSIFFSTILYGQNKKDNIDRLSSISVVKDIRYATRPDSVSNDVSSDRLLDLYIPNDNKGSKLPVYIYIHGGGFSGGDKNQHKAFCAKLASYGIAVISPNYRLYLKHNKITGASCRSNMSKGLPQTGAFNQGLQQAIKQASGDAVLVLNWIKENSKKYNLDTNSITISGGSAGAITALYTGLSTNSAKVRVKNVVNLWGGIENNNQIINTNIPVLTFHGDKDDLISVDYAYSLHQFLKEKGNLSSKLIIMEGIGHGAPAYNEVINNKMETILDFLKEHR
ncbi:alpha/beta hydrolase [Pseudopedobacter beijingensis]|uniref:Alpha/beta hydrolase n=1 Tax=Pseudopedobacter beijingensis TaxID=1207056 RepID=A0ABW4IE39_9SPHI